MVVLKLIERDAVLGWIDVAAEAVELGRPHLAWKLREALTVFLPGHVHEQWAEARVGVAAARWHAFGVAYPEEKAQVEAFLRGVLTAPSTEIPQAFLDWENRPEVVADDSARLLKVFARDREFIRLVLSD